MKVFRFAFIILLLTILIPFLISSCSDDSPSGPDPDPPNDPNAVSEQMGPDGGEITSQDGELTLTFPEGALPGTETITIEELSEDDLGSEFDEIVDSLGIERAYELGPDGLEFSQPVTARLVSDQSVFENDTTLSVSAELLLTSENGTVEPLDSLRVEANADDSTITVSGRLRHFSVVVRDKKEGVMFTVFIVPTKSPFGKVRSLVGSLSSPVVLSNDNGPIYQDLSEPPFVILGSKSRRMPFTGEDAYSDKYVYKNNDDFNYKCSGVGNGEFEAVTFVRGPGFPDGIDLQVEQTVECIGSGTIIGQVTVNGEGLSGVNLMMVNDELNVTEFTQTDNMGNYNFDYVGVGTVEVRISEFLPEGVECPEGLSQTITMEDRKTIEVDFPCVLEEPQEGADLEVEIVNAPESLAPGETGSITIKYTNNGPENIEDNAGTVIEINENATITGVSDNENANCDDAPASEIGCNFPNGLQAGDMFELPIEFEAENSGTVIIRIEVSAATDDPNEDNNVIVIEIPIED